MRYGTRVVGPTVSPSVLSFYQSVWRKISRSLNGSHISSLAQLQSSSSQFSSCWPLTRTSNHKELLRTYLFQRSFGMSLAPLLPQLPPIHTSKMSSLSIPSSSIRQMKSIRGSHIELCLRLTSSTSSCKLWLASCLVRICLHLCLKILANFVTDLMMTRYSGSRMFAR